jgi:hypothetical protein
MARRLGGSSSDADEYQRTPPALAVLETTLVTVAAPLVGYWIRPHDPFLLHGSFSWLCLAPLLTGLRYGFAHGFGCALALILAMAAGWRYHLLGVERYPATFSVGLMMVGMLAGEFCDTWTRRLARLGAVNAFRRMRLTEFTHAYHVLKVSHDRIEQVFAGSTQNLRESISTMRRELLAGIGNRPPLFGLEKQIVATFANHGWIQVASLYAVDEAGKLQTPALAEVGDGIVVDEQDQLIRETLRGKHLTSVRPEANAPETKLLAAIPIVDVYERVWAVLAVRNMLFIAFHDDNLHLLSIIGGHIGDLLAAGPGLSSSRNLSIKEFLGHVRRSILDHRRFKLPVALLAISPPDEATAKVLTEIVVGQRRGLDQVLQLEDLGGGGRSALLLLMPLTEERGVGGYIARLGDNLKRKLGKSLPEAKIAVHTRLLSAKDEPEALVEEMRRLCGMDEAEIARNISA